MHIWDAKTGETIAIGSGHTDEVTSVAWSHDSRRLASVSDDYTVRIWDPKNGDILQIIGMEHAGLSLTGARFSGAIGLNDTNTRLIEQRGGIVKEGPKEKQQDYFQEEKKIDL